MNKGAWLAVGLAGVLVFNAVYAFTVPEALHALTPAMPLGYMEAESPSTPAGTTFTSITEATGIHHTRHEWTGGDLPYPAVITGGLAAGDVDGNGFTDLYFPPGGPGLGAHLYLNQGNWTFTDATHPSGLSHRGWGAGAVFGDYDNDGDEDLYVLIDHLGVLYENDGTGVFKDVTQQAGLSLEEDCRGTLCQPSSAAWVDHDRDGDLDLFIVNNLDWRDPELHTSGQDYSSLIHFARPLRSMLYENQGNGTFDDITRPARAWDTGKGLGVTPVDMDRDGWPDLLTANDVTRNAYFYNRGDCRFRDLARKVDLDEKKTSMGIQADDLTGDGRPDVIISNFRGQSLSLLLHQGDGTFSYATQERGLGASWRGTGWGVQAFDYDLDGWLDVTMAVGRAVPLDPHERDVDNVLFPELKQNAEDQLYRNLGDGFFAEATATAGAFSDLNNTRGLLAVDLDRDGDLDIVRVNVQGQPAEVLENRLDNDHGYLSLDLVGTLSNRDGYGARLTAETPTGHTIERQWVSAAGYQTGLPDRWIIGLGEAQEAQVTIHWPSGIVQDLGIVEAGEHTIEEPVKADPPVQPCSTKSLWSGVKSLIKALVPSGQTTTSSSTTVALPNPK